MEFIDARSSLTGAELNLNVTRFEVLARQAELDYATAAGTLPLDATPTCEDRYDHIQALVLHVSRGHAHRRLRQERCAAGRQADAGAQSSRPSNGPAVPPIDTNGIVVTKHEMRLSFKMGGLVRRIYVQEGDVVKQGQRLAEIELTEVNAQVEQARQMAEKAARDLKRGENLYADQVISLEQLQDLRTQAAMAERAVQVRAIQSRPLGHQRAARRRGAAQAGRRARARRRRARRCWCSARAIAATWCAPRSPIARSST